MIKVKERSIAQVSSVFPGLGHLYLGKYKHIILFLIGYLAMVTPFAFLSSFIPKENNEIGLYLIATFMLLLLYMVVISHIDVAYQCDRLHLSYHKGAYEFHIKNYGSAYRITTLLFSIIGIGVSILITVTNWVSWIPFSILLMWVIIAIVGNILIKKFRNVKYSELKKCSGRDN